MPVLDSLGHQQPTEGSGPPASINGTPAMEASPFKRCTGHCCTWFGFQGITLADFRENLRRVKLGLFEWPQKASSGRNFRGPIPDIETIVEMLVPWKEGDPASALHPWVKRADIPRFRCRYLVEKRCTIYERRPHFCRSYPDHGCEYRGCTRDPL